MPSSHDRNKQIMQLKNQGMKSADIARKFEISGSRVGQIYDREKKIEGEMNDTGSLYGLSYRARTIIGSLSGMDKPMLIDLQKLLERLDIKYGSWRMEFLRVNNCGPKTLKEIEEFASEKGILKQVERLKDHGLNGLSYKARNTLAKLTEIERPMLIDLQKLLERLNEEDGNWRPKFLKTINCGKRTVAEVETYALANGVPIATVMGYVTLDTRYQLYKYTYLYAFKDGKSGRNFPFMTRVRAVLSDLDEKHGDWRNGIKIESAVDPRYKKLWPDPIEVIAVFEEFVKITAYNSQNE